MVRQKAWIKSKLITHILDAGIRQRRQLHELTTRYEAIVGGFFPLRENTNKQVKGLEDTLRR